MVNFYNIDNEIVDTAYEYPCIYNDIYILNLKEGELLISYDPSFMQNSNGLLVGIDSRFKEFYVINRNQVIVKRLSLQWINNCDFVNSITEYKEPDNYTFLYLGAFILISVLFIKYIRGKRYENSKQYNKTNIFTRRSELF
jgi:uncharacterized Fe-S cluster-containing radical SAM superfamily protein